MILQCVLFILVTFCNPATSFDMVESSDLIEMKSKLSRDKQRLLVQLTLPQTDIIAFELYNKKEKIIHLWEAQDLKSGQHNLSLQLPELSPDTYIVQLVGEKYTVKQLLFLQQ